MRYRYNESITANISDVSYANFAEIGVTFQKI